MNFTKLSHIEVSKIMQGNKNAILLHANKRYMLSITRRGKLILTAAEKTANQVTKVPSGDVGLIVP